MINTPITNMKEIIKKCKEINIKGFINRLKCKEEKIMRFKRY